MTDSNSLTKKTQNDTTSVSVEETSTSLTAQQCTANISQHLAKLVENNDTKLSDLFPNAIAIIKHYFQLPVPLLLVNSSHWLTAKEVLLSQIKNDISSRYLKSFDQETLFGRLSLDSDKDIVLKSGAIQDSNNGVLILNISPLLVNPNLWFMLKSFIQRGFLQANDSINSEKIKQQLPNIEAVNIKIILVATRLQLDELIQIDPEYSQVPSLFCELASQIQITQSNFDILVNYCQYIAQEIGILKLNKSALNALFHHLTQQCQHQQQVLFSIEKIQQILMYANLFTDTNTVTDKDLMAYFKEIEQGQSLPRKNSEQSIIEGQVNLQLSGEKVGQINGLSVVELLGYPCEFGEVFRISASDMIGDGEIIDVERKVELAGNIHAKSTLIVQGYLNHFFSHINTFPYSCNLVFEQSYQESDGDSASLAILLAVSSCYAKCAAKQNAFVTGALDQHGNVLAIGGVNQKIDAVTRLFELNLTKDPVIIVMPKANTINLTLNTVTLNLIESGKITIHAISHCHQAFPILLGKTFNEILKMINHRIELAAKEELEDSSCSMLSRLLNVWRN